MEGADGNDDGSDDSLGDEFHDLPIEDFWQEVETNPGLLKRRDTDGYLPLHNALRPGSDLPSGSELPSSYVSTYSRLFLDAWPDAAREWSGTGPATQDDANGSGPPRYLPLHLACAYPGGSAEWDEVENLDYIEQGEPPDAADYKAEAVRIVVEAYPEACQFQVRGGSGEYPLDLAVKNLPTVGAFRPIVEA
jgi:hypothetical protein